MSRQLRPTLQDVADWAGVGLRTTKKVMNNAPGVAPATQARVLAAADELGYRKNVHASALARARRIGVAVVYAEVTPGYFPGIEQGFREFAEEHLDFGLEVTFRTLDTADVAGQRAILRELVGDETISGVVLQPVSATGLDDAIGHLVDAGKPVVTFGADAPDSSRLTYVGPDAHRAGRIGAQVLSGYLSGSGRVLIVSRGPEHMQTRDRRLGFLDRIAAHHPGIRAAELVLSESHAPHDQIREALASPDWAGVFATSADSQVVGEVLRDLGRDDVVVVGFDLSPATADLMREDLIQVILEQHPSAIAYEALKVLFGRLFHNQAPDPLLHTPVTVLTSECLPPAIPTDTTQEQP